jgi:hypothetical protein
LRVGETLLMDAIVRILRSAETIGCVGIAVDALDDAAESFYRRYQFFTVDDSKWPPEDVLADKDSLEPLRLARMGTPLGSRPGHLQDPSHERQVLRWRVPLPGCPSMLRSPLGDHPKAAIDDQLKTGQRE